MGGRDPNNQVADVTWVRNITLSPNGTYNYQGSLTLSKAGNYHFFAAYQKADGTWNTSIPTEGGATNVLDINVVPCWSLMTTASPSQGGSVTRSPSPDCPGDTNRYKQGTGVTLTAIPNTGWTFSQWSGDASVSINPTTVTMDRDKSVTANFQEAAAPPPPVISSSTHPSRDTWYGKNNPSFSWTAPADPSGIAGYSYVLDRSESTIPDTTIDATGNSAAFTNQTDGILWFHVAARNNAGKWGAAAHYKVMIDTQPPSSSAQSPQSSSAAAFSVSWSGKDSGSGVKSYDVQYREEGAQQWNDWLMGTQLTSAVFPYGKEGRTYLFRSRALDFAGNPEAYPGGDGDSKTTVLSSQDMTPPAAIGDLRPTGSTANSVTLTWTAPGDDGYTGTASSYDIRYSPFPITDANWSSATQAAGAPIPRVAGSVETFTVTGLNPSTTYYFALKTSDEVPNVSPLSNVETGKTSSVAVNHPPVARVSADKTSGSVSPGQTLRVTFTARDSYDEDKDQLSYRWYVGGILKSSTGPDFSHDFGIGTHDVLLKVSDGSAESDPYRFRVVVSSVSLADPKLKSAFLLPDTVTPGSTLRLGYNIENPNAASVTVILDASIRNTSTGVEYRDTANRVAVDVAPGGGWYPRAFVVPANAGAGTYDVAWFLLSADEKRELGDPARGQEKLTIAPVLVLSDGMLLKGSGDPVYYIQNGQRRLIPDPETFNILNLKQTDINKIPDQKLSLIPMGQPVPRLRNGELIRAPDGRRVFRIEGLTKRWIRDDTTLKCLGYDFSDVKMTLEEPFFMLIKEGTDIPQQACQPKPPPGTPPYNTPFLSNEQMTDYTSMSREEIREFMSRTEWRQHFKSLLASGVDGPSLILRAAQDYQINPKVILTTIAKEGVAAKGGVNVMGAGQCATAKREQDYSTIRGQIDHGTCLFRRYLDQLEAGRPTTSGWKVGVPKKTEDGVNVTPANKAVTALFTYTPYAGAQWGGNQPRWGGNYLFFRYWNDIFRFGTAPPIEKPPPPQTNEGLNNPSSKSAEPVNTATGNYIYQHKEQELPGRGLPFAFERTYNSKSASSGPLGPGWTHSYNILLAEDPSGSAAVKWGDGHEDYYDLKDGAYTPKYGGVYDTLAKNQDGTFTLTRKDQTRYSFNALGRLASIQDRNGNTMSLAYDAVGNLITVTDTVGRRFTFEHDSYNRLTLLADPVGRTVRFRYGTEGDLAAVTDPNGGITSFEYDANHWLLSITSAKGNLLVRNTYDANGRVIEQSNGKGYVTKFSYDEAARKTTITDPLGNVTVDIHDSQYRLIQQTDPLGNSILYTYDSNNNRTSVTDKNGNTTFYSYDSLGNVTGKTDPLGNVTTIEYDDKNNPIRRTDALANVTTYTYEDKGNLASTTDPLGNVTRIHYDSYGQPITLVDANGKATANSYGPRGSLVRVTDALGNATSFAYDEVGRRTSAVDANSNATSFAYDALDNLLTVTDALGNKTTYTYDANGNRTAVTDPSGNKTTYAYDANDLLSAITDPLQNVTTYTYDAADNKVRTTDARLNTTYYSYDGAKNLVRVTDALGNATSYTYDGNGNKLVQTNAKGKTTTYAYDALNRPLRIADPLGNATTNTYDALGRLTSVTDANGNSTRYTYDALGRLTSVTDANGNSTRYTYDALGRLTEVTDAMGGVTRYLYDKVGNRASIINAQGNETRSTYDAANRLVRKADPLGNSYTYGYDGAGNRTRLSDAAGNTIEYRYDANNRLSRIGYPDGTSATFAYDARGNRVGVTDQWGSTAWEYDALNRLTSYRDSYGNQVKYTHDAAGNRVSVSYPDPAYSPGWIVSYTYDPVNRMKTVTDWLGNKTTYTYDSTGNVSLIANPNGTMASYTYDDDDRLVGLVNAKSDGTVISSYGYTLDGVGNRVRVAKTEPLAPTFTAQDVSYRYDVDDRLLAAGDVTYVHNANGDLVAKTGQGSTTSYKYDYQDRLVEVAADGVTTQYRYDGLGNRVATVENGMAKRYVLDLSGALSQVLAETDGEGKVIARYVYGLGLISRIGSDSAVHYYHYDPKGSAVATTDPSQKRAGDRTYDPFGPLPQPQEGTLDYIGYLGRFGLMQERNGLLFVRNRYYDPATGRFITRDLVPGSPGEPQSLNAYSYAMNNPISFMDITGLTGEKDGKVVKDMYASSDSDNTSLLNASARQAGLEANEAKDWSFRLGQLTGVITVRGAELVYMLVRGSPELPTTIPESALQPPTDSTGSWWQRYKSGWKHFWTELESHELEKYWQDWFRMQGAKGVPS